MTYRYARIGAAYVAVDRNLWIFYVEFLASCLQECGESVGEAVLAHRTRRMTTLIGVFDAYERAVAA